MQIFVRHPLGLGAGPETISLDVKQTDRLSAVMSALQVYKRFEKIATLC